MLHLCLSEHSVSIYYLINKAVSWKRHLKGKKKKLLKAACSGSCVGMKVLPDAAEGTKAKQGMVAAPAAAG